MTSYQATIAANRFGLGARPGELMHVDSDTRSWLERQLGNMAGEPSVFENLPGSQTVAAAVFDWYFDLRKRKKNGEAKDPEESFRKVLWPYYRDEAVARAHAAILSESSFRERLVLFWSNHFAVSSKNPRVLPVAGSFEREAIRPHVTGRFVDMLLAVEAHPAMLFYLDNFLSIGPNSQIGQRRNKGLNENLAREILELHTLGVDGGYGQADVVELSKAITGWTVADGRRIADTAGTFKFVAPIHEPGERTLLGRRYPEAGMEQGTAILRDLAVHPATARHIAVKLARHFIADEPPQAAVTALEKTFLETDGDLAAVSGALIARPEAWREEPVKFKSPHDYIVSVMRSLDLENPPENALIGSFLILGQQTWAVPSPAGWPDSLAAWGGPDAMMKRAEWAMRLGERAGDSFDAESLGNAALGPTFRDHTRLAVQRAESRKQALALLAGSPDFQWR